MEERINTFKPLEDLCHSLNFPHILAILHNQQNPSLATHAQKFLQYSSPYALTPNAAPQRIKQDHSLRVLEHACRILLENPGPPSLERAALLAALYHDCGRFEQFFRYATYKDDQSCNHAHLGLRILKEQQFLCCEEKKVRHLCQGAIVLHNLYKLPVHMDKDLLFVTQVVRDSDKIDIFRIMAAQLTQNLPEKDSVFLHVQDENQAFTPKVAHDVLDSKVCKYSDLRYVNDFRLLLCSWLYELNFNTSKQYLIEQGFITQVLEKLPNHPLMTEAKRHIIKEASALEVPARYVP